MISVNSIRIFALMLMCVTLAACGKKSGDNSPPPPQPSNFNISTWSMNNFAGQTVYYNVNTNPSFRFKFPTSINRTTVTSALELKENSGAPVQYHVLYETGDSAFILQPHQPLNYLTRYKVTLSNQLKSVAGGSLINPVDVTFTTSIDSGRKFPAISDDRLLDLVQRQTFKYFWDFAHPTSGLARERNTSGDIVTSGGSGFGIMSILVGINRNFISRAEGLARMQKIVGFLKSPAQQFHGAYPHWLNGASGAAIPFCTKDNGADLVETSYLFQGLLCARQFFNGGSADETNLRNDINTLWNAVEWDWFRKNNEDVLYWHWSPNYNWEMNHPIRGWNEALITYALAASSTTHSIPKTVYDNGWAKGGGIRNNASYYGIQLPLGEPFGGPLFFAHYSFLTINPKDLADAYANYWTQNTNHTLINYNYCKTNPKNYYGYSDSCWGLTASDVPNGYTASSPTNDVGVIAPTAALSSFPYTPTESMKALKFFYYKLGDKLWGQYGFYDAFRLQDNWFANSYLAIDQGPIVVMIENYRTGLLWNLFMSCPEVKTGMQSLGFQSPYL